MVAPWLVWLAIARGFAATSDAEHLVRQGRVTEAVEAAATAAAADPDDLEAGELYVDLLLSLGLLPRAVDEAERRVDRAPSDPNAWYLLGRARPDATRSREAYETALRLDPAHARAHMGMAALHEAHGDLQGAEVAYSRAVAEQPDLGEAWVGLVRLAMRHDRPGDARSLAEQGVVAVPGEATLALMLADLAPEKAIPVLQAAVARAPDEPALQAALAEHLLAAGEGPGALRAASAALAIDPSSATATRVELFSRELADRRLDAAGLAALFELRRTEHADLAAAATRYAALAEKYPRSALVHLGRASIAEASGDRVTSLAALQAAVALDGGNVEAAAACGLALLDADRPAEAEPLLTAASRARPWDASLLLGRWKALVGLGRKAEALAVLEPLVPLHRFDPGVQVAWAGSLADAGRAEDAYLALKGALLSTPDPRIVAAFVQIAPLAGHGNEAAAVLDTIVARTGSAPLAEAARRLRAAPTRTP